MELGATPPVREVPDVDDLQTLTVVIPTLDAQAALPARLREVERVRTVVSDGGSADGTLVAALRGGAVLAVGSKGRGQQLRRGGWHALAGGAEWMLFLHADTALPEDWREVVGAHMASSRRPAVFRWGAEGRGARLLAAGVRVREALLGLPYGDQGLLVPREVYECVGGYAPMSLFEDVDMVRRLRAMGERPVRLGAAIRTDISAYRRDGVVRRAVRNLRLLWRYFRGASVETLLARYR